MRFLTSAPLLALVLTTPAHSQPNLATPAGWNKSAVAGDLILSQPATNSRLQVKKLAPLGGSLRAWFTSQTARDSAAHGTLLSRGVITSNQGAFTLMRQFRSASGAQTVIYVGYNVANQGRLLIFSAPNPQTVVRVTSELTAFGDQLAQNDRATERRLLAGGKSLPQTQIRTAKTGNTTKIAPVAARGTLKSSQILGVFLAEGYTGGVGGMVVMEYSPVLLLRDGSARRDLEIPPLDLNLGADKAAHPRDWGRWSKQGAKYVAVWSPRDKDDLKPSFKTRPARAGETLGRAYSSMGGGGNTALGGSVMTYYSNSYTFAPNGTFTSGKSGGGSGNGVVVNSTSKNAGRYRLDGHALTLRFGDGRVVRKLFYFYPDDDGKHDVIGIGDDAFIHDK